MDRITRSRAAQKVWRQHRAAQKRVRDRSLPFSVAPEPETITVIVVTDPVNRANGREVSFVPYTGEDLAALKARHVPRDRRFATGLNNRPVSDALLDSTFPRPFDLVSFVPVVRDPGDVISSMGGFLASFASIGTAVATGGLLSNILGGPQVEATSASPLTSGRSSQTYSWQPQTVQQQGGYVSKSYGTVPHHGTVISWFRENRGTKQYMNLLVDFGLGPIDSFEKIEINDQSTGYYPGLILETRLGHLNQSHISNFGDTKVETPFSKRIVKTDPWDNNLKVYAESSTRSASTCVPSPENGHLYMVASVEGDHAPAYANTGATQPVFPTGDRQSVFDGTPATQALVNGVNYTCIKNGTKGNNNLPGTGVNWTQYWITGGTDGVPWADVPNSLVKAKGVRWVEAGLYPYVETTEADNFTGLEFDISCLKGCYSVSGGIVSSSVVMRLEIAEEGTENWKTITRRATSDHTVNFNGKWSAGHWIEQADGKQVWEEVAAGTTTSTAHHEGDEYAHDYAADEDGFTYGYRRDFWHWFTGSARVGTAFENTLKINGSGASVVRRTVRADETTNGIKYRYRLTKLTNEKSNASSSMNETTLTALRTVVSDRFEYPRHVLLGIKALAVEGLSSIKVRVVMKASLVKTYDAATETWTVQHSDRPAWVDWDVLTRPVLDNDLNVVRYDGEIDPAKLDLEKYVDLEEYNAGAVDDGAGGTEPRHTFNGTFDSDLSVHEAAQAVEKIGHFTHVWLGTEVTLAIDKPGDPVDVITVRDMEKGAAHTVFAPAREKFASLEGTILDRDNDYAQTPIRVVNDSQAGRTRTASIDLIGCTSQTESTRHGYYQLKKDELEDESVDLVSDLSSTGLTIGDRITWQPNHPDWGINGAVVSATTTAVELDEDVTVASGETWWIKVRITDPALGRKIELRPVTSAPGTHRTVTVSPAFSSAPSRFDPFILGKCPEQVYTIKSLDMTEDMRVAFELKNYVAAALADGPPDKQIPIFSRPTSYVEDLALSIEAYEDEEGTTVQNIAVTYSVPADTTLAQANVYYRKVEDDGSTGDWTLSGSTTITRYTIPAVDASSTYEVCVTTDQVPASSPAAETKLISTAGSSTEADTDLELDIMKLNFQYASWAQFAIFDGFADKSKRADPDPSTNPAVIANGAVIQANSNPGTVSGFVSADYPSMTTIETGIGEAGAGHLIDVDKTWYTDQCKNLTLLDATGTAFNVMGNTPNTIAVSGTPASGAYSLKDDNPAYMIAFCAWEDSIQGGGFGFLKMEVTFDGAANWQTVLDTEHGINSTGGTVAIAHPGTDYAVRFALTNDENGKGPVVRDYLVCTDPSPWRY